MRIKFLILLFFVSLVLRLSYNLHKPNNWDFGDGNESRLMALNYMNGNGFSIESLGKYTFSGREPFYGWLMIGHFSIFGENYYLFRFYQDIIGSLFVALIFGIAYLFTRDYIVSIIASIISCFYPFFIFYDNTVLPETYSMFFLYLIIYILKKYEFLPPKLYLVFVGILFGLIGLSKSSMIQYMYFLFLLYFIFFRGRLQTLKNFSIILIFFFFTMSPWIIRNFQVHKTFVLSTVKGGHAVFYAFHPYNTSGGPLHHYPDVFLKHGQPEHSLTEVEESKHYMNLGIKYLKENPSVFFTYGIRKIYRTWKIFPSAPGYEGWTYRLISLFSYGIILVLSIIGIFISIKNGWRKYFLLYSCVLYIFLLHSVFLGSNRYRLIIEPILIIFASMVIAKIPFVRKVLTRLHVQD